MGTLGDSREKIADLIEFDKKRQGWKWELDTFFVPFESWDNDEYRKKIAKEIRFGKSHGLGWSLKMKIPSRGHVFIPDEEVNKDGFLPIPVGRFQVLYVDHQMAIKNFVDRHGIAYKRGHAYYQLSKSEKVQLHKNILLIDKTSGDVMTGPKVRELLGLSPQVPKRRGLKPEILKPVHLDKYRVFVQSTSYARMLQKRTCLLYEVGEGYQLVMVV